MNLEEFYRLMESNTYLTREEISELTIPELSTIVKDTFGKELVIKIV